MNFVDKRKKQLNIKSLHEQIKEKGYNYTKNENDLVFGPEEFDCLNDKWSKKEVLGLIGGSGSGKTSISLEIFRHILQNSKDPNSIVIFVSLEMTTEKIAKRWINLVGEDSELTKRFYIISQYDENDKPRMLNSDDILREVLQYKHCIGAEVAALAIDHLHIIQPSETTGQDFNKISQRVKDIAVQANTFVILLSQTTKEKSGSLCDKALDADGSYACSQFKWISSYVITVHQPLASVRSLCKLNCLAWAYMKIREKHKDDKVLEGVFNLLYYDLETGRTRPLTSDEMITFTNYYAMVLENKKENDTKDGYAQYNTKVNGKVANDVERLIGFSLDRNTTDNDEI